MTAASWLILAGIAGLMVACLLICFSADWIIEAPKRREARRRQAIADGVSVSLLDAYGRSEELRRCHEREQAIAEGDGQR